MQIETIKSKIDKLNQNIDLLEQDLFRKTKSEREVYITKTSYESSVIIRWFRGLKNPKLIHPNWIKDKSRIELNQTLDSEPLELNKLASQLNLFTLHAAIILARLNADKRLIFLAEELRQAAEKLRMNN